MLVSYSHAQDPFSVRSYQLPGTFSRITGILIDPVGKAQVPLLGGIYTPADSSWFIPPRPERYITSYAAFPTDTALLVISNTEKNTMIDWIRYRSAKAIQRQELTKMNVGVYQVVKRQDNIFIWGVAKQGSRIGLVLKDSVGWFFKSNKLIRQVQIDPKGQLYFAADSMIFNLTKKEKVLANTSSVYGFDFASDGRIYLTTDEGFGYIEKGKMVIVAPELKGYVACFESLIFVQPQSGDQLFEFKRNGK